MRPIKFRAWHKYIKEMLIPEQCLFNENGTISSFAVKTKWDDGQYIVKNEDDGLWIELMQFTWILDKNWKGIYEGDIVLFERNRDWFAELQWRKEIKFETDMYNAKFDFPCFDSCEVIWNIYENPDLLSK